MGVDIVVRYLQLYAVEVDDYLNLGVYLIGSRPSMQSEGIRRLSG